METETRRIDLTSPRTLLALAAFIVAFALLSFSLVMWLNASNERRDLERRLNASQSNLAQLLRMHETAPRELERQLEEVRQRLEELLGPFPSSEEVALELLAYDTLAERYDANIVRLESLGFQEAVEQAGVLREETYDLEARGAPRNLFFLLKAITETPFETFFFRDFALGEDGPAWAMLRIKVISSDFDWETWQSQIMSETLQQP